MAINIQQMCGNGGSIGGSGQQQSPVRTMNNIGPDANGNIKITADDLGAALASLNVRTLTKVYQRYIAVEGHENTTPMAFLWTRGKGNYFLRTDDGVHFVSCVDVSDELKARIYINIPEPTVQEDLIPELLPPGAPRIAGGVYIGNHKVAGISSRADLSGLSFSIGSHDVVTMGDIEDLLDNGIASDSFTAHSNIDIEDDNGDPISMRAEYEDDYDDQKIHFYGEDGESPVRLTGVADPIDDYDAVNLKYLGTVLDEAVRQTFDDLDTMFGGIDYSEDYAAFVAAHPEYTHYSTAARAFIREICDDGIANFTTPDGDYIKVKNKQVGTGNDAIVYRAFFFKPHSAEDKMCFEYWVNDTRLIGFTNDRTLRLLINGKHVAFTEDLDAALEDIPSPAEIDRAMTSQLNEITAAYNPLSVIRTRLEKLKLHPETIRVMIDGAELLDDEDDVILQLWICSRKHGTAHHWWHPGQTGSPTKATKIGYAMIAGDLIYPNRPLETDRFPAIPSWMPNNGYMKTEISVSAQDLKNGYVDIDVSKYFLPMVKPKSTVWRYKDVTMMFTQRKPETDKRYSVPVTWKVAVLRNGSYHQIGLAENIARIGFRRGGEATLVDSKAKRLKSLHISIK